MIGKKITAWLAIFIMVFISACGKPECNECDVMIKKIILYSPGEEKKPLYKLTIPSDYVTNDAKDGTAMLKAAYPGMVSFSSDIKHRFYNEDGTWGPDLVRIFFGVRPEYIEDDKEFTNRNDLGRFVLEGLQKRTDIKSAVTPKSMKYSESIKTYINRKDESDKTFVVTHGSGGRISVIRCSYRTVCEGKTSWNGVISVSYKFTKNNLVNIVELDKSVYELFERFNPTLLIDEE